VAGLYRAAGLGDVQGEARADIYPKGHTRRWEGDPAEMVRDRILACRSPSAMRLCASE
jgi:hypothetical protein